MTNNDVLRRLRYAFNYRDGAMIKLFDLGGETVSQEQVRAWLKSDDDAGGKHCDSRYFSAFLDGFIIEHRGVREDDKNDDGAEHRDWTINNNIVLRKLKIALNLKAEEIIALLKLAHFNLGKHELSAFFRRPNHKHYRECKDQVLRNFLNGLQQQYRLAADKDPGGWKQKVAEKTQLEQQAALEAERRQAEKEAEARMNAERKAKAVAAAKKKFTF